MTGIFLSCIIGTLIVCHIGLRILKPCWWIYHEPQKVESTKFNCSAYMKEAIKLKEPEMSDNEANIESHNIKMDLYGRRSLFHDVFISKCGCGFNNDYVYNKVCLVCGKCYDYISKEKLKIDGAVDEYFRKLSIRKSNEDMAENIYESRCKDDS